MPLVLLRTSVVLDKPLAPGILRKPLAPRDWLAKYFALRRSPVDRHSPVGARRRRTLTHADDRTEFHGRRGLSTQCERAGFGQLLRALQACRLCACFACWRPCPCRAPLVCPCPAPRVALALCGFVCGLPLDSPGSRVVLLLPFGC